MVSPWELWNEQARALICPRCGCHVDIRAIYEATGLWKLHLIYVILFTGLAAILCVVATRSGNHLLIRVLAVHGTLRRSTPAQ